MSESEQQQGTINNIDQFRKDNFRKASKKVNRKYTRNQTEYTSAELPVKKQLEKLGMIEGLSFFHNVKFRGKSKTGRKCYFWLDFVIPKDDLVIECSPSMWHNLKRRTESDIRKREAVTSKGYRYVVLTEHEIERLKAEKLYDILLEVLINDQNSRGSNEGSKVLVEM